MDVGLKLALDKAGSRYRLAKAIGISNQAVCQWTRIPAERVRAVADALRIPARKLRPDIFDNTGGKPHGK